MSGSRLEEQRIPYRPLSVLQKKAMDQLPVCLGSHPEPGIGSTGYLIIGYVPKYFQFAAIPNKLLHLLAHALSGIVPSDIFKENVGQMRAEGPMSTLKDEVFTPFNIHLHHVRPTPRT